MKTRIQKWGNSLALRIPRAFAEEARLKERSVVEMRVSEGVLTVAPAKRKRLALDELMAGVTNSNLHKEVRTGRAAGREEW